MLTRRAFLGASLGLAAGAAAAPVRALGQTPPLRINVVYTPVMIFAPLFVAIERGYFRDEGIEATLISTPGGTSTFAVLASGHAEAAVGGLGAALFNAADRNLDFKVVGPAHSERPPVSTPLVVDRGAFERGQYQAVRDLRGKRVSVNVLGSATEFWLNAALLKGGLTMDQVQVVEVNFPDVPAALANGAIAGAMMTEPLTTLAEDRGQITRLSQDFINNVQVTAVYFGGPFMRAHPGQAAGFMAAWLRACRYLYGRGYSRDDVAIIVQKYTGVPADVVKRARPPYHEPNGKMNTNDFARLQEFFKNRGELTYDHPLPASAYISTTYVEQALKIVGPFSPPAA